MDYITVQAGSKWFSRQRYTGGKIPRDTEIIREKNNGFVERTEP